MKCIARDVSRAFYGLREWLVSCDFPMGLWWGWKDVTQRAVSMRAERGGGNLEWFSQGTTLKELGNRVSRFLMCCRYFPLFFMVLDNMLLNDFLFWNVWCADVQTEGWKKLKTGEKRRNIFRFYAISISVGFAVKMQWTRVGWGVWLKSLRCNNSQMLFGTCTWHKLRGTNIDCNLRVKRPFQAKKAVITRQDNTFTNFQPPHMV